MGNLTSLTCPNCGGKLAPASTANLLVCLHCGVEHLAASRPEPEDLRPRFDGVISLCLPEDFVVPLVPRGTRLPAEVSQTFSTSSDNQTRLEITLVFGDSQLAQENTPIGTFAVKNIAPAPRGVPALDVRLSVDEQRQLTVTVTEESTKRTEVIGRADLSNLAP